jgi:hypothetical protein
MNAVGLLLVGREDGTVDLYEVRTVLTNSHMYIFVLMYLKTFVFIYVYV